jgi:uncharacterized membrane protein YccC
MPTQHVEQQAMVEHAMLKHICNALRVTLDWKVEGDDFSRHLSSLRFVAQSLQRHLDRMMALEECEGYMDEVVEICPRLAEKVGALKQDHERFRQALSRILSRLDHLSPTDLAAFTESCGAMRDLLEKLDEHSATETVVIQEAYLQDEGGSG